MKDIIEMIKKDKKIMVFLIVIVVALIALFVLPNIQSEPKNPTIGTGSLDTSMTLDKYLQIKNNSTLLFPKTNDDFRYNVYDNYIEITECLSDNDKIIIPGTMEGLPVLAIRGPAFKTVKAKNITFENGVVYIDKSAFENNEYIETVTLANSVLKIGDAAFARCINLKTIDFGKRLVSIDNGVFLGCVSLSNITFPDTILSIGANAFNGCTLLTSITLPKQITSVGEGAFAGCASLLSVSIPKSLNIVPLNFCSNCSSLSSIQIEEGPIPEENFVPRSIGEFAFANCPLIASVYIPKDFGTIADNAFDGSSKTVMIYGYMSSPAAIFAAQKLLNFSVIDIENFNSVSQMFIDINKEITTIKNKYTDEKGKISKENAPICLTELTEYGKLLKEKNKNLSGYGLENDYFIFAFINGQKLEVKLNIDPSYYRELEEVSNA